MFTNNIKFFVGSLTLVVLLVVLTCAVNAEPAGCKPMKETMERLKHHYKENMIFRGISTRGHITLIHFNEDKGTWSDSIIRPTIPSVMCGVDAGTTGELLDYEKEKLFQ